jgi:hypothetical protein
MARQILHSHIVVEHICLRVLCRSLDSFWVKMCQVWGEVWVKMCQVWGEVWVKLCQVWGEVWVKLCQVWGEVSVTEVNMTVNSWRQIDDEFVFPAASWSSYQFSVNLITCVDSLPPVGRRTMSS